MPTTTDTSRTAHLLALMKRGDDAFNARDFAAVDQIHHPDMIAYITGLAKPVHGEEAHAAAMPQYLMGITRSSERSLDERLARAQPSRVMGYSMRALLL